MKTDNPKPTGWTETILRRKCIAITSYLRKQKSEIKTLTLHLKKPKKEEQTNLKLEEGKKS